MYAEVLNSTHLVCESPSQSENVTHVPVEVSCNQQQYSNDKAIFYYHSNDEMRIDLIYPTSGPVTGNTVVTVSGHNFISGELACMFGSIFSPNVEWVSNETVLCTTPENFEGAHEFKLSHNYHKEIGEFYHYGQKFQ